MQLSYIIILKNVSCPHQGHDQDSIPGACDVYQAQAHEVDWQVGVDVRKINPEAAMKFLVPEDKEINVLKDFAHHEQQTIDKEVEEKSAQASLEFEQKGEPIKPSEPAMIPKSIGDVAHRLMQSGDYADGEPFPRDRDPGAPWHQGGGMRAHPELATDIEVETVDMGGSRSAEMVRCFEGDQERPCHPKACGNGRHKLDPTQLGVGVLGVATALLATGTATTDLQRPTGLKPPSQPNISSFVSARQRGSLLPPSRSREGFL